MHREQEILEKIDALRLILRHSRGTSSHSVNVEMLCKCITCYVVEASVPTIILFCVIHEDIDDLYKWPTF